MRDNPETTAAIIHTRLQAEKDIPQYKSSMPGSAFNTHSIVQQSPHGNGDSHPILITS
jgi:hypothetical protein